MFDFEFSSIRSYYQDAAIVLKKNGKYGLFSIHEGLILDYEYDSIITMPIGIEVRKDGKFGFLTRYGKLVAEVKYEELKFLSINSLKARIGNKWESITW